MSVGEIGTPPGGAGDDTTEANMSELINKSMDQHFAQGHEQMSQTAQRFNDGSGFVAQESKQMFLIQKMLIGATAQNMLEKEGLADTLLQLKTSGTFPNNLPSGGNVAPDAQGNK